jgi:hypothetical protein
MMKKATFVCFGLVLSVSACSAKPSTGLQLRGEDHLSEAEEQPVSYFHTRYGPLDHDVLVCAVDLKTRIGTIISFLPRLSSSIVS